MAVNHWIIEKKLLCPHASLRIPFPWSMVIPSRIIRIKPATKIQYHGWKDFKNKENFHRKCRRDNQEQLWAYPSILQNQFIWFQTNRNSIELVAKRKWRR